MDKITKNFNLNTKSVHNKIIKYLHDHVETDMTKPFRNLNSEHDLEKIRKQEYVVVPRFLGVRSWIIIMRDEDNSNNCYAVNFPKQNKRSNEIKIHPIDCAMDGDLYNGTIMEGIYYRSDNVRYL